MLERPPRRAAVRARKARYRERRLAGRFIAPVEVTPAIVDCLVALHWLHEVDAADPRKVGEAIVVLLESVTRK